MLIVGAGLSGLIAANLLPDTRIIERGPERDVGQHRALLRFRGPEVGNAIGIEFKKVQVHKGIFFDGYFRQPDIRLANLYSQKVIGTLGDRSIWKIETSERYIAPEDLYARLIARCKGRIEWSCTLNDALEQRPEGDVPPIISTAPLGDTARLVGMSNLPEFKHAPIKVRRWRIPGANVFQTIYFPSNAFSLYRASITGDLLIAEYVDNDSYTEDGTSNLVHAFALTQAQELDETKQKFGKIAAINEAWRREAIFQLTHRFRIYSLGRFATWRNILLDDVLKDVYVIKRLLEGDAYSHLRGSLK